MALLYEKKGKIARITLNRPEVMNAINLELAQELFHGWCDFVEDSETVLLIITGAGDKAFCTGADLKERGRQGEDAHVSFFWDTSFKLPMRHHECFKPVIAAINGHCLAGGLELALLCDIRIASENATFGQPEINWGVFPGMGATQRLPRVLPYNLAAEILFTGRNISAERALEIGLVNRVVPLPNLMDTAWALAEEISEKGPLALRAVKEALLRSYDLSLAQGLRLEGLLRRIVGDTKDALEGMKAFQERRKPRFRGR
ncbi:MAG: enoyl-CoA hydratase/isomerase family protein [Desulfobacteraceae bacterium]|jgi:E-phenylitaconyl-CoA hydratase